MAINFPSSPANGDEYIDAGSGTEWVYNSTDKSWTMTGAGSSSPFNFRGGYNFTTANTIGAVESGDLFIHEGADGAVGSGYTGLSGQITAGTLVLWDGDEFIKLSSSVPGYPDTSDPNYQNGTLDDRYLSLAADAGAQTVQSNDPTEFVGGILFSGGVPEVGEITGNAGNIVFNKDNKVNFKDTNPDTGEGPASVLAVTAASLRTNGSSASAMRLNMQCESMGNIVYGIQSLTSKDEVF